jgi:hypothetical protein
VVVVDDSGFRQRRSGPARPGIPPLEVRLLRNGIVESRHRVHAVVCDQRGRVLMRAGDPQQLSFVRSALKPFQATVFVGSGAADRMGAGERGLAIACASHAGTAQQAREAFKLLWGAELDTEDLQCPTPAGGSSPLQHNCSGKHAAFLAACRQMHWPLESYLQADHPLQQAVINEQHGAVGRPAYRPGHPGAGQGLAAAGLDLPAGGAAHHQVGTGNHHCPPLEGLVQNDGAIGGQGGGEPEAGAAARRIRARCAFARARGCHHRRLTETRQRAR